MSTQKNNVTNQAALLRVGAEFHFADGAATVAAAQTSGFAPFGNIVDVTPNIDTQKVEHVSSNRGAPRKDREGNEYLTYCFKPRASSPERRAR